MRRLLLVGFWCLFPMIASADAQTLKLPAILGDHMVLQQDMPARLWGWAQPGQTVTVQASWDTKTHTAKADEKGRWRVQTAPPRAGQHYTVTISAGNETIRLNDILAGEVWLASGQSNMHMSMTPNPPGHQGPLNAEAEIAAAHFHQIRLFQMKLDSATKPKNNCRGKWRICTPTNVGEFSAVGYFFARDLHHTLHVPIGVIHASCGGTRAESWTPRQTLDTLPFLQDTLKIKDEMIAQWPAKVERFEKQANAWIKTALQQLNRGLRAAPAPKPPVRTLPKNDPAGLFNGMIAPLTPLAIRGVIWYQGEANAVTAEQYHPLFSAMIEAWRNAFNQPAQPFYFVQLANWDTSKALVTSDGWACLREAQLKTYRTVSHTGMASAVDIGQTETIHPRNKQEVARRLLRWALAKTYDRDTVCSGPLFVSAKTRDRALIATFESIGSGLVLREAPTSGFELAGSGRRFVPARARIENDTVIIEADEIEQPVAVRYAWKDNPVSTLYNREGLPASPFRTDDWPVQCAGKAKGN